MTRLRKIGVLGGMGPQATVRLMQKIIDAVPAEDDSGHIPLIVDNHTQVPSRIKRLIEGTGEDPAPVLREMAVRLERAGAEALAMPCNTAHLYADDIEGAVGIPFLNMLTASAQAARRATSGDRIGLLASPAVRLTGLFDRPLAAVGLEAVYPEDQDAMLAAIRSIKKAGATAAAEEILRTASAELRDRGAAVQLIACTELSVISEAAGEGTNAIDTLDVLVSEIVNFSQAEDTETRDRRKAG